MGFGVLSDVDRLHRHGDSKLQIEPPNEGQEVKTIGLNLPEHTADGSWNLPVPATFVLDRKGMIRARHVDVNYAQRMEPADILKAIRSLS